MGNALECQVQKSGEIDLSNADQRRRYGEAYRPLFSRIAGGTILSGQSLVGENTLTLNWKKPVVDPNAGKPSEKAELKTRPRGRK